MPPFETAAVPQPVTQCEGSSDWLRARAAFRGAVGWRVTDRGSGCGPLSGFIPMLESARCEATGVDPEAPGTSYRQVEFERCEVPGRSPSPGR